MRNKVTPYVRIGIIGVSAYFILSLTGLLYTVIAAGEGILRPVSAAFNRAAGVATGWFVRPSVLAREREEINRAMAALARREIDVVQCAEEKKELKDLLHYRARVGSIGVTAQITGFDVSGYTRAFLDRGEEAGIRTGMAVIAYDGILIGRIRETAQGRSVVSLLRERGTSVAVSFAGQSDMEAILAAQAGGLVVNLLPQHSSLATGTVVLSAGVDARIPRGLIIGRVKSVSQDRTMPYAEALVEPYISYRQVRMVTVYTP